MKKKRTTVKDLEKKIKELENTIADLRNRIDNMNRDLIGPDPFPPYKSVPYPNPWIKPQPMWPSQQPWYECGTWSKIQPHDDQYQAINF